MRRDIDRRPQRIKGVLLDDGIRKEFLAGASKLEEKVVKAFAKANAQNALKSKPKVSSSVLLQSLALARQACASYRACGDGCEAGVSQRLDMMELS